jgi:hypothetical protein
MKAMETRLRARRTPFGLPADGALGSEQEPTSEQRCTFTTSSCKTPLHLDSWVTVFADTYYAMIVRGGGNIVTSYANGVLTVNLAGKARNAAGNPSNYGKLPVGSGAWVDRPLNAAEPVRLKQTIAPEQAQIIITRLRVPDNYWKFYCKNTNQGYFDVLKSEHTEIPVKPGKFD